MNARIRVATENDAAGIQAIYAPIVAHSSISFEIEAPTISEIQARIHKTLVQYPWIVCELNQKIIGYAYGSAFRLRPAYQWSAEVSVYVDSEFYGRGIGKSLYKSLFELLKIQGYYIAVGGITLPNKGSVAIHKSLGFKPVAVFNSIGFKLGAWHDIGFWQLELKPHILNPTAPIPLSQLAESHSKSPIFELQM